MNCAIMISLGNFLNGYKAIMNLLGILCVGSLGAVLMFCGDMSLYYDKNDYESNGSLQPIIDIMKNVTTKRLYVGGILAHLLHFYIV